MTADSDSDWPGDLGAAMTTLGAFAASDRLRVRLSAACRFRRLDKRNCAPADKRYRAKSPLRAEGQAAATTGPAELSQPRLEAVHVHRVRLAARTGHLHPRCCDGRAFKVPSTQKQCRKICAGLAAVEGGRALHGDQPRAASDKRDEAVQRLQ